MTQRAAPQQNGLSSDPPEWLTTALCAMEDTKKVSQESQDEIKIKVKEGWQEERRRYENTIADLRNKHRAEIEAKDKQIGDLDKDFKKSEGELKTAQLNLSNEKEKVEGFDKKDERSKETIAELQKTVDGLRKDYLEEVDAVKKLISGSQVHDGNMEEEQMTTEELKIELAKVTFERDNLRTKVNDLESALQEEKLRVTKWLDGQKAVYEKVIEDQKVEYGTFKENLKEEKERALGATKVEHEKELEEVKGKYEKVLQLKEAEMTKSLQEAENRLKDKDSESAQLTEKLKNVEQESQAANDAAKLRHNENVLALINGHNKTEKDTRQAFQDKVSELETENETLKEKLSKAEDDIEKMTMLQSI